MPCFDCLMFNWENVLMISTPLHLLGIKKAECKLLDLYSYSFFFFVLKLVTPKALGGGKKNHEGVNT